MDQIVEAEVNVAGYTVPLVPNSLSFTPGSGEQMVKVASLGGGAVDTVYCDNVESKKGGVKFNMYADKTSIEAVDNFKIMKNTILITLSLKTKAGDLFTRVFRSMALINHPEVQLQADGVISLEFEGKPSI